MDPMLLVANRSFQDMRDAADRERLLRTNAPDRRSRIRAAFGRLVATMRPVTVPSPEPTDAPELIDDIDEASVHQIELTPVRSAR